MPNASLTESTATTNTFQFTLRGYIESVEGALYLVSRDNIRFRVKEVPSEFPQGVASWQVIPSTDSTGILQNLSVESYSTDDTNGQVEDECQLLGRVVQLGKKSQFVQLKISRPGKKTLKLSFLSPDWRMKIGQLWQVVAIRRGEALHIHSGQPVEQNNQSAQKQPITPQNNTVTELQTASNPTAPTSSLEAVPHPTAPTNSSQVVANQTGPTNSLEVAPHTTAPTNSLETVTNPTAPTSSSPSNSSTPTQNNNTNNEASLPPAQNGNSSTANTQSNGSSKVVSPPIEVAIAALVEHTQTDNWELRSLKQRNRTWEWQAFSRTSQRQARVKVVGNGRKVDVYEYPFIPDSPETLVDAEQIDRLVVTPLGAAMGIGASCFQILIGPYEIVLDCGTRPKGYDPLPALDYVENPNLLLISHGHQDHIGAVPVFHSRWPAVRMISTPGTREIAHVMLQDC
ncbi:MAG TPA: MBL fold metallo-hydrolase, partial [Cyanophyceae cyanobacterium]